MQKLSNLRAALLEPGFRVDRYELLAKIGQGGMASVWLARADDVFYAIKTILPQHASDEQLRRMMLDEARIAMAIDHPHVARTLEVGQLFEMPYLVLEYVAGESLDQLCQALAAKNELVPPAIAARLVADTCAGLHAAHEQTGPDGKNLEIVHRDLSPHNILVDDGGRVKLIDFGIAKAAERLAETASGATKGKVPYMAPEQALDTLVDRRADLWSLGAVLYVLLSGRYPFDGSSDATRLVRKLSGDPPMPLPRAVPRALREVVERALSFHREDRYATAADLGAALDEAVPKAKKSEVAEFFAASLGPAKRARALIVEHALAAARARDRAKDMLGVTIPPSSRRPTAPLVAAAVTSKARRSAPRGPWLAYLFAAAITLVIIIAFVMGSRSARRDVAPSPVTRDRARPADPAKASAAPPLAQLANPSANPSANPNPNANASANPNPNPNPSANTHTSANPSTSPSSNSDANAPSPAASASSLPGTRAPEDSIF